ncbi:Periplasmic dipeptide transport protein [Rubrobacter xylanophilus DSM 9941]|uniref:ABC transporter substrate-binding protein n=1 Tax=Rubrobacter xylanophilus TaxID=49319 RepID=UPI001C63DB12|nr:ABC transporter substrate-binding protein [Rubrobacter xylanophilus]QYJ15421.1 Periplasmic dipeptide transport protein [Rubrobacter xylanophilus DSM 9941]
MEKARGIRGLSRREFLQLGGAGLAGAALLGVAGCGGGETIGGGQQGGGEEGVFTFGRGADSVGLDPINVTDGESLIVCRQVFDGLLDFKPETTDLVPALATEIPEPEEGGRVYTFRLREGVTFHDGEPFNAEAVVFNFERWKNTDNPYHKGGGSQSSNFAYYAGMFGGFDDDSVIESVEAVDERTVRFTLREVQAPFLRNIAMSPFGIASPRAIRENVEQFWKNPVGTGPFKFVSWDQGATVRLEKNPDWWGTDLPEEEGGGGPFVDRVVFRSIPDNTARVAALSGGQLSGADGLTPDDVPTIEEDPDLKVITRPPMNIGYLAMNVQKEPFNDRRVRLAVVHAINMPEIVEAFFGDTGQVASNAYPPTIPYFREETKPYEYDPERARQLLREAGLGDGFEAELWYMPIPRPYMPDGKGIAQAMQRDLREVGIDVRLVTREWGTYLEETGRGAHDMCLLGWTGDNGDPDNFLNVLLSSKAATETDAQNVAYYKNPELDRILERAASTIDEDERRRLYVRAQEIVYEDAPWAPIAYAEPPLGFQNSVQGYHPSPTGGESFNSVRISG